MNFLVVKTRKFFPKPATFSRASRVQSSNTMSTDETLLRYGGGLDPFKDAGVTEVVHVHMQQQGRRKITIIQGLPEAINMNRVLRYLKKVRSCFFLWPN